MRSLILFLIIIHPFGLGAQTQEEKIREYEMQRQAADQRLLNVKLDSAILLSDTEQYLLADEKFKELLGKFKSVPSNLVFYFGKNSFHLEKYKQSIDWLNKYIELKGTGGQYSQLAVEYLTNAESGLLKQRQASAREATQILSQNYDIDCGPTGKVTCPVCKGTTVIVKKGYFNDTYRTCPYCSKHGYLDCDEYNRLVKGKLEPSRSTN